MTVNKYGVQVYYIPSRGRRVLIKARGRRVTFRLLDNWAIINNDSHNLVLLLRSKNNTGLVSSCLIIIERLRIIGGYP